jgi:hypothetical protein
MQWCVQRATRVSISALSIDVASYYCSIVGAASRCLRIVAGSTAVLTFLHSLYFFHYTYITVLELPHYHPSTVIKSLQLTLLLALMPVITLYSCLITAPAVATNTTGHQLMYHSVVHAVLEVVLRLVT